MLAVGESLDPYVRRLIPPQRHTQGQASPCGPCASSHACSHTGQAGQAGRGLCQVEVGGRQLELPVFVGRAVLPADRTLVKVSNLPWEWQVEGITQRC